MSTENFLSTEDEADAREAIQSVLSNTFGRHPFTLVHNVSSAGAGYGESNIQTPTPTVLQGLVTDARRLLDEDQNIPVQEDSDAVLVLSADYLSGAGVLGYFGSWSDSEYNRQDEIVLDGQTHRIAMIGRAAQFGSDYLVYFVSLMRKP